VVDGAIGRLRAGLASRGLAENTAIVLLSDHGESLHEDRRLPENHGRFLYNPLIHVPLAVVLPGIEPGELSHPVSLLDVPATLLDLVGASAAAGEIEGESLLPLLLGAPASVLDPPRLLPLNETDQFGVIAWPHKLMVRPDANLVELYDLSRDFGEHNDLAESQPELVRWLTHAYHALPGLKLDRTNVARRRWEVKAEATRPESSELQRLSSQLGRSMHEAGGQPWLPGRRPMALTGGPRNKRSFMDSTSGRTLARVGPKSEELLEEEETPVHAGIVIEPLSPRRKTAAERRRERRLALAEKRARKVQVDVEAKADTKADTKATTTTGEMIGPYQLAAVKVVKPARSRKSAKARKRAEAREVAVAKTDEKATSAAKPEAKPSADVAVKREPKRSGKSKKKRAARAAAAAAGARS
jgi:hypothetical protein